MVKQSFPAQSRSSRKTNGSAEILMVEDSATDAELAIRAFHRARIANPLTIISSSEEATAYLLGTGRYKKRGPTRPLMILLDLQLPGMSGLDFLGQIKIDPRTWKIPVVTLSMTKSAPKIVMCLQRGVVDHLIKPVGFAGLIQVAKRLKLNLTILPRETLPAAK
jgi:two-component system response regulator